jgi:hypothetical protein
MISWLTFAVLLEMKMSLLVIQLVTRCRLIGGYYCFRETWVLTYKSTRCHITEDHGQQFISSIIQNKLEAEVLDISSIEFEVLDATILYFWIKVECQQRCLVFPDHVL